MEPNPNGIAVVDLNNTKVSTQTATHTPTTDASLVYIYPSAPQIGRRYLAGAEPIVIGRAAECPVSIPDSSVSRFNARIERGPDGRHVVTDLESTNGTFVNNMRATNSPLGDGDYLRIGNCIFRYLASGNVEANYHEEIYRLTVMDPLTGIHNRRYLMEMLHREVARAVRHNRPLSLALVDVDHFKSVNDQYGHVVGDLTLREIASRVGKQIRSDEVFARYGGEEFAIVLTETDLEQAAEFGERVRATVEAEPFTFESYTYHVTVSVGVAMIDGAVLRTPAELTQQADEKLYEAKRTGRNRVAK